MEPKTLELDLGFAKLKAMVSDHDGFKEIYVDLLLPNGSEQPIVIVGNQYMVTNDMTVETIPDRIRVLVYGDPQNEDYTHQHVVHALEPWMLEDAPDDDPMQVASVVFQHGEKR